MDKLVFTFSLDAKPDELPDGQAAIAAGLLTKPIATFLKRNGLDISHKQITAKAMRIQGVGKERE